MKQTPSDSSQSSNNKNQRLVRCLSATDLVLLGIGAIIGAGLFVLTGIAAAKTAGPGVMLSYIIAGVACGFSALAYAELASSIGGCGSAYGYAFAAMGKFVAFLVGWDLLLEYGMDVSTIAIGWSGYIDSMLQTAGISIPTILTHDPFHHGIVNLPAVFIIFLIAGVLTMGTSTSVGFNKIIVCVKMLVIAFFIVLGSFHFNPANWHPLLPFGFSGAMQGAGLVFFAYIGFDAVSTAAEESRHPARDLPIGILGSVLISTLVYVIVAGVLTGMTHYSQLDTPSPVSSALALNGLQFAAGAISFGAIAGLTTAILAMYFGLTRIYLAMARDNVLPQAFLKMHPRSHSPNQLIWIIGSFMAIIAGFFPITAIANIVNIGTLAAFIMVSFCVILLRIKQPAIKRTFKMPGGISIPLIGILLCGGLMATLPAKTWLSFFIWMLAGCLFYFTRIRQVDGLPVGNNVSSEVS